LTLWLSWSRLRSHEECKQKGYLERGHKKAPLSNERVFFPGNVTDRVVRDLLQMPDAKDHVDSMADMVKAQMNTLQEEIADRKAVMTFKDANDARQVEADCIEAVQKIAPALKELVLPFDVMADYRFKAPVKMPHPNGGTELVMINGAMDILVHDPDADVWSIYDVKHTRDGQYWRKTQGQLGFYDLAVKIAHNGVVKHAALLQPLVEGMPVKTVPLEEDSRRLMLQRINRMAQEVWRGENAPRTDSKYCQFCTVKHACTKFKPTIVNGRRVITFGTPAA
jgi:hypothetical protein